MTPFIAVSQRVDIVADRGERRDALDQRWVAFLHACGYTPLLVPNHAGSARALITRVDVAGILLTGGNDLSGLGGNAPERDDTERMLVDLALEKHLPLAGVCRGMQLLQDYWNVPLHLVDGHVATSHSITDGESGDVVNSYHRFASTASVDELCVTARAEDGVVEAVRHQSAPIIGMMWHPERYSPFRERDIRVFRSLFSGVPA